MAAGQQFNLRWNNHTNNILTVFNEQLANESLTDVTLSCEGHYLKVHKMVLSACSPYFQEMFRTALHQVPNAVIIMSGMKFNDVKLVVDFMYRGEIKVQEAELDGLLAVAESLQVKGLSNVRNKYEKGDIETSQQQQMRLLGPISEVTPTQSGTPMHLKRKRRRLSEEAAGNHVGSLAALEGLPSEPGSSNGKSAAPYVQMNLSTGYQDDDLPATIKVEPPDIRDIDEEAPAAPTEWESPKLVMDLKTDEQGQTSEERLSVGKRVVVGSVIVKRGRGRPRKNRDELEQEFLYQPLLQQAKSFMRMKTAGVPLKKLTPGTPTPWIMRKRTSKIPRPPNAFMIFANEYRRKLAYDNPRESNKDISVRLGIMWKNLPPEVKETYYAQSRTADEEHKRKYPGYYYSPKEARLRKNLKHDLAIARRGPKGMDANFLVNVMMPDENEYLMLQPQTSSSTTSMPKRLLSSSKRPSLIEPDSGSDTCIPGDFVTVKIEEDRSVKVLETTETNNRVDKSESLASKENDSAHTNEKSSAVEKDDTVTENSLSKDKAREENPKDSKSTDENSSDETSNSEETNKEGSLPSSK